MTPVIYQISQIPVLIQTNILDISKGVNTLLILFASFLVFFMQPGFSLLEVGQVRAKNTANVAMKNLFDWSQGVLAYFFIGSAIAVLVGSVTAPGATSLTDAFIHFSDPSVLAKWLFGAVFAMTAATIVSGAVVGRIKFLTYIIFGTAMVAVIYPVVEGIAWHGLLTTNGYLGQMVGTGYLDFAGGTVVHMTGGIAGLIAADMVGPRRIRYDGKEENAIPGHSVFFSLLGAFVLAFGWYGFNVGTHAVVLSETGTFEGQALAIIAVNTTLAMGAGTLSSAFVTTIIGDKPDPLFSANGFIAGLVGITSGAAYVTWWGSIVIGGLAGMLVMPVHNWVVGELQVDDAISVFPVHACAGALGTFLIPFFATDQAGNWQFLGMEQVLMQGTGILVIAGWTSVSTITAFKIIDDVLELELRVSESAEEQGLDASEHGISAYPEFALTVGPTVEATDGGDTGSASAENIDANTTNHPDEQTTDWRGQSIEMSSAPATDSGNTTVWRGQEVEVSNKTEYKYELEAVTDRLKMALDETETGVWEMDLIDDEFIIDDASERLLGFESGAFPGTVDAFFDRIHPDDVQTVEQAFDEVREESANELSIDFRVQLPSGQQRWLSSRGVVKQDGGEPAQILGVQTDLTEQKEDEQKLQRQNERLEKFASVISHDLRNPIGIAEGYLDLAEETGDEEDFQTVREALTRMDTMIDELLTMAEAKTVVEETEQIDLSVLASDAWQTAQTEGATLETTTEAEESIEGNRDLLLNVFENLFRNAVDHNDPPVTVRVGTLERSKTGFYIEDDGNGIPEDERDSVFDHGHTTSDDGTGFGLYIVSELVTAHGWDIEVKASKDGGARFEILTEPANE
jgi:Amt family ammonium transporter